MVPDEQRSGQAADFVTQLQLTQTGQQVWRFQARSGPEVFQAQGGVAAQGVKQRIGKGLGLRGGQLESQLGRHVASIPDEGGPVPEELVRPSLAGWEGWPAPPSRPAPRPPPCARC